MSLNINPNVINWIVSFLSNRKQRVVVDGFVNEFASIIRGVPQGTVLGPILVNLRNRTGQERRRQTLCDKRDNNSA